MLDNNQQNINQSQIKILNHFDLGLQKSASSSF